MGLLDGGQPALDAVEARRASPQAFVERELSQTAYENLSAGQAKVLALRVFPKLVEEPSGGPPQLPAGERILGYPADNVAQVALPAGKPGSPAKRGVIESLEPIALQTSAAGHHAPIDLGLREAGGAFRPSFPLVAVRLPKRLSSGVALSRIGVSLTPVDAQGSPVAGSAGEVDGAGVVYANTSRDADTFAKPNTFGFSVETLERSAASPRQLFFRVGMPSGARLIWAKDGSGALEVVADGVTIATVPRPSAHDAEGTAVPLSVGLVSGNVLAVTVAPFAGYRLPIAVDPQVEDSIWQNEFYFSTYYRTNWEFHRGPAGEGGAFTAPAHPEGGSWTESISGSHNGAEYGGLFYTTRGASQITLAHAEGHWNDTGSNIQNYMVLYTPKSPYTEDYDALPVATEEERGFGGYACAPARNCPETTAGPAPPENNNMAAYQQESTAPGGGIGGSNTIKKAYVQISQEQGPELSFNKTSPTIYNERTGEYVPNVLYGGGGWLGPHSGAFEADASDPGIGLSYFRVLGHLWGKEHRYFDAGECFGVQCPAYTHEKFIYNSRMVDGETGLEALAEDKAGLYAHIEPENQKIKVDGTPPHGIKIGGLQNGNELPLGEAHLKVEATDGEGSTHSSGVKSIKVKVDGQEVTGSPASCPEGPCTASTEFTLAARAFTSGQHSLVVTAADNVDNVVQEEFKFRVHGATPVSVGPGSVDPSSGQLTLSASDVSLGGTTGVARTYQSRNLTAGAEGPLGPQWAINLGGDESLTVLLDGSAVLNASGGASTTFTRNTKGEFESPTGDSSLKLEAKEKEAGKGISEYVLSDATAGTKTKFEQPTGTLSTTPTFANQFGTEPSQLNGPISDAVDPSGDVWVTSFSSNVIEKFSSTGSLLASYGSYGTEGGQFSGPWGIAVDPRNGNVLVSDQGNNRIEQFSSSGVFSKAFGWGVSDGKNEFEICTSKCQAGIAGSGNGQFNVLAGVAVDSSGNVWVADYGNNRIQELNEKGEYTQKFGSAGKEASQFEGPFNVALSGGNLYITDYRNNRVQEFSTSGTPLGRFGESGSENGQFSGPSGVATDPRTGNLYVADAGNKRVQELTPSGVFVTKFGTSGTGPGQFANPEGAAVSSQGAVYVVNLGANQVKEWTRPTWVPTEAGGALAASTTTYAYTTVEEEGKAVIQPSEALAPIPPGVSSCTPLARGCRALTFNYANTTTASGESESEWGDYKGHLTRVYFHAWDPAKGAMTETEVVRYLYDKQGRLRAEWDPRIEASTACGKTCSALKTIYGYDAEGHITAVTPPGQESWALTYGTIPGDPDPGRLLKTMRPTATTPLWAGEAPKNTEAPKLSGSPVIGVTMGVSKGKWSNSPIAYGYQWEDCNFEGKSCTPIPGATNPNYTVAASDGGHVPTAVVTATNGGGSVSVSVAAKGPVGEAAKEYALPPGSQPARITQGSDGNLWYTDNGTSRIGKITTSGAITEYPLPPGSVPIGITRGPDGNVWYVDAGSRKIGKITTSGAVTEYPTPTESYPYDITQGPDGNLWYTNTWNKIGKITTSGVITEYTLPPPGSPSEITQGPDGNLWYTHVSTDAIGKITTSGVVTEYPLPAESGPFGITQGPEGSLWFADQIGTRIGNITTSGVRTEYSAASPEPGIITQGPDGNLWYTNNLSIIGKMTTSGVITQYVLPEKHYPSGITQGPDGDLWYTTGGIEGIGRIPTSKITTTEEGKHYGPEPGSTIEYGVPASGGSAPNELGSKEAGTWGQKDDPVEGAAIFPPDEPQSWPASSYKRAAIHYFDHEGRLVNTASPGGGIATSEYNGTNDVVRALSADNRAAALKEGGKSAEVAERLDTKSAYNTDGTELLETLGPEHKVKLASGSEVQARNHVAYHYDQGSPEGRHFGLVTETTDGASYEGKEADVRATKTSYSGAGSCEGQQVSGWTLRKPTSVTTDPGGLTLTHNTVYDPCTGNVLEATSPAGTSGSSTPAYSSQFGSNGTGKGQLKSPKQMATDTEGNIWVADEENNRIDVFSEGGAFVKMLGWGVTDGKAQLEVCSAEASKCQAGIAGAEVGEFKGPRGIALANGKVWVVDTGNNRTEELTEAGAFVMSVGATGAGKLQFNSPRGITIDSHGNPWIADDMNNRIEKLNEKGEFLEVLGWGVTDGKAQFEVCATEASKCQAGTKGSGNGEFNEPKAELIDPHGNLLVADGTNGRLQEFNEKDEFVKTIGSKGSSQGQFNSPKDLRIDSRGNIWVVDEANSRVVELNEKDEFLLTFGWGVTDGKAEFEVCTKEVSSCKAGIKGSGNGEFNNPWGIELDSHGNILVSEEINHRIQKFTNSAAAAATHTVQTIYYTAGSEASVPACRNHPEWVGLPCQTQPAAQPGDEPNLPVSTVAYNIWDEVEATTETFGSTTRVKAETYDPAGRALTSETTSSIDASLPKVTNKYSEHTGALEVQSTTVGETTKTITSVANKLGQLESYTDADGNTAKYSYDIDGRVEEVSDGKGEEANSKQTYIYDTTTGAMTKLVDMQGTTKLTFTATYSVEGKMLTETYPNGMNAMYSHDPTGQSTSIEYVKSTHCATKCPETWFSDGVVSSVHGETLAQTSTLAKDNYAYDHAGRLTEAQEEPTGKPCVTRLYSYDEEANRTSLTTREGSGGKCATEGGSTEHHTYDPANRLIDTGVSYEAFGNTTKLPAADAGKYEIASTYYVDNQLQSQTQNSKTTSYAYDPAGRTRETTSAGKTSINHYAGAGEALTWTSEGAGTWTRNIPGIDGTLCATQISAGITTLQLHDLQGNIIAAAGVSEAETKLLSTYNSTEFGVPQPGTTPPKYAWLGATGLATEASSPGSTSKGGASYVPLVGKSLQTGPIASPGAFPDGTATAGVVQASYLQAAASVLKAIAVEHQAAEEAANRRKAEEEAPFCQKYPNGEINGEFCNPSAVGGNLPAPTEGGAEEYVDPTHPLVYLTPEQAEIVGLILFGGGEAADAEAEELAGPVGRLLVNIVAGTAKHLGQELLNCAKAVGGGDSRNRCLIQYHTLGIPSPFGTIDTGIPYGISTTPCFYFKKARKHEKRGLHCA